MHGSFKRLGDRVRILRAERSSWEATITVERADVPRGLKRFSGIVLIDDRQVGWLVGGEKRDFVVAPGQHEVAVLFARRILPLRTPGSPGDATARASVSLAAGERMDLLCGSRPDVVKRWHRHGSAEALRAIPAYFLLIAGPWIGGSLSSFLRWIVAPAIDEGFLNPVFYQFVSAQVTAVWFALLLWWVLRRFKVLPRATYFEECRDRLGSPYYLELAESKPGEPSPAPCEAPQ